MSEADTPALPSTGWEPLLPLGNAIDMASEETTLVRIRVAGGWMATWAKVTRTARGRVQVVLLVGAGLAFMPDLPAREALEELRCELAELRESKRKGARRA